MTKLHGIRKTLIFSRLLLIFSGLALGVGLVPAALAQNGNGKNGNGPNGVVLPAATLPAYTLEDCIQTGLANQPALKAALASRGATLAQVQALENMRLAGLISRELPIRRKQASLGVVIADSEVNKVQWETTYAITRNYFSAIYAKKQEAVIRKTIDDLVEKREFARSAIQVDPLKVNQADIDKLSVYIDLVKVKLVESEQGVERARAALREAMGIDPCAPLLIAEVELPLPEVVPGKEQLIALALSRRGSMIQAATAAEIVCLEVAAQNAIHQSTARTFAAGADIHANPVPQGTSNGEYRPSAIGIEMPTMMVGSRADRVRRAQEFHARAAAVVEKTQNLIALETADAFLKWQEAYNQVQTLADTPKATADLLKTTSSKFELDPKTAGELIQVQVLDAQVQAQYNEALYKHALALAALERITAGGFVPAYRKVIVLPHH